jgi:hypothetical protein
LGNSKLIQRLIKSAYHFCEAHEIAYLVCEYTEALVGGRQVRALEEQETKRD